MLDFLFPQTLEKVNSSFNGEIKVIKQFGHIAVWVEGFEQSGPIVEKLWKQSINLLKPLTSAEILILGLGCGVVAKLLSAHIPNASLTGVEIDPLMIKIGKKYFALDKIPNLEIICADAKKFTGKQKFDVIIIDLYKGSKFAKEFLEDNFLSNVSNLLTSEGTAIFNCLTFGKNKEECEEFESKLKRHFQLQQKIKTDYNNLFKMVK